MKYKYICTICGKEFDCFTDVLDHIEEQHFDDFRKEYPGEERWSGLFENWQYKHIIKERRRNERS